MKIPAIEGVIDRRVLINFTVDPEVIEKIVPAPFKPKNYKGKAIVGVCLIRLKDVRPKGLPAVMGLPSENGAHRIAVAWIENGETKEGVFNPRRDSSSWLNRLAGGRFFPGKHFPGKFDVKEEKGHYHLAFNSADGTSISIEGSKAANLHPGSIFQNLEEASRFFERGAVGYSPNGKSFDGLALKTFNWKVEPLLATNVHSSFFENKELFPDGSVRFDNALLMTEMKHEWHSVEEK